MNTTKQRLTVIALLGILTVSVCFYQPLRAVAADDQAQESKASTNDLAMKLIGTWKLETASNPGSPSGIGTRRRVQPGCFRQRRGAISVAARSSGERITWIYADENSRKESNKEGDWPKDTSKPNQRALVGGWWPRLG